MRKDRDLRRGGKQQGVAVGRGMGDIACSDGASCSNAILDDESLVERLGKLLAREPSHYIGIAAGREWHDDGHSSGRPIRPLPLPDCGDDHGGQQESRKQRPNFEAASMCRGCRHSVRNLRLDDSMTVDRAPPVQQRFRYNVLSIPKSVRQDAAPIGVAGKVHAPGSSYKKVRFIPKHRRALARTAHAKVNPSIRQRKAIGKQFSQASKYGNIRLHVAVCLRLNSQHPLNG
jgi:hypothetical protein